MKILPTCNYILCEQIKGDTETVFENGISFVKEQVPEYKIIDIGESTDDFRYSINDIIITNTTPTKINLDNNVVYLINKDNIIGNIVK